MENDELMEDIVNFSDHSEEETDGENQSNIPLFPNLDFSSCQFIHLSSDQPSPANENWVVHFNGVVIQPEDAFQRILLEETKLGSRSTASIFLAALKFALTKQDNELEQLIDKMQTSSASSEFTRKIAFRLLGSDKIESLVKMTMRYCIRNENVLSSLNLVLQLIRQLLFATVDVRLVIMRKHFILVKWIVLMLIDLSTFTEPAVYPFICEGIKCLQDLCLIGEQNDFFLFLNIPLIEMFLYLFKVKDENVTDNCIRLLSFIFEYSCEDLKKKINESGIFVEILNQLCNNGQTQMRLLDHLSSHFTTR